MSATTSEKQTKCNKSLTDNAISVKVGLNNFLFERNNNLGYFVVNVMIYRLEYISRNWSVKSITVKSISNELGFGL